MKILVVDDMITMRHVMLHMLRDLGHIDNDEAADGLQAINMLHKKHYDLVITDFHMPKLDGKQLLEKIRSEKELANLPVLMVSCEDEKKKIKSIIASKVTGFIVNPFNANTLEKQLKWINAEQEYEIRLDG
jgi:two-component system chemotaxis response regulator CheY